MDPRSLHSQRIDRTNTALILANTYYSLQQYIGQREGIAPEAECACEHIATAFADTLKIDIGQAKGVLTSFSDDRHDSNIGRRNDLWKLAG